MHRQPLELKLVLVLVAFAATAAIAQDDAVSTVVKTPAMLPQGQDSFAQRIVVPEDRKKQSFTAVIRCQTYVQHSGELKNTLCVRDSVEDMDLRRSVLDAVEGVKFLPARVGDEVKRVYMPFMVAFSCSNGECGVLAVPHHGYHIDQLGLEYVAPQAIMDEKFWDKRAWERTNSMYLWTEPGYLFFLSAEIDEQGRASDVSIDYADSAWRTEARRAATHYEAMNFIPGVHNGAPAKMRAHDFTGVHLREAGGPR